MSPAELVPWFQMASTVIAAIGIGVSVSLGIASLNNNRRDRLAKIRPNLLFNIGGQQLTATLRQINSIPGLNQTDIDVVEFLKTIPRNQKAPSLDATYGQLYNHGVGSALSVHIWFEPELLSTKEREHRLTGAEQCSPPYTKPWNTVTAMPANLPPGNAASFGILPMSVHTASEDVIQISGAMHVECADQDGFNIQWTQPVTFLINRSEESAAITITFRQRLQQIS